MAESFLILYGFQLPYIFVAIIISAAAIFPLEREPEGLAAKINGLHVRCFLYYILLIVSIILCMNVIPRIVEMSETMWDWCASVPALLMLAASIYSLCRYILARRQKAAEEIVKIRKHALIGIAFPLYSTLVFRIIGYLILQ